MFRHYNAERKAFIDEGKSFLQELGGVIPLFSGRLIDGIKRFAGKKKEEISEYLFEGYKVRDTVIVKIGQFEVEHIVESVETNQDGEFEYFLLKVHSNDVGNRRLKLKHNEIRRKVRD